MCTLLSTFQPVNDDRSRSQTLTSLHTLIQTVNNGNMIGQTSTGRHTFSEAPTLAKLDINVSLIESFEKVGNLW